MRPRFGLYLPPFGPLADPALLIELARRAERSGWDGIFLWDHILDGASGPVADPWVVLEAVAAATSRVQLWTLVTPLARRRPWVLARQAATVRRLSGERCVLGAGPGSYEYGDFNRFSEQPLLSIRAAKTDEALQIVTAMWSDRPYTHAGLHYRVNLDAAVPEPYRIAT